MPRGPRVTLIHAKTLYFAKQATLEPKNALKSGAVAQQMKRIVSAHQLQSSRCNHKKKKSKEETATTLQGREEGEQL